MWVCVGGECVEFVGEEECLVGSGMDGVEEWIDGWMYTPRRRRWEEQIPLVLDYFVLS